MKFPRLTTRRLMILVALVAVGCESGRLVALSRKYRERAQNLRFHGRWPGPASDDSRVRLGRQIAWAQDLTKKYDQASRRPWVPIESDPPEPE